METLPSTPSSWYERRATSKSKSRSTRARPRNHTTVAHTTNKPRAATHAYYHAKHSLGCSYSFTVAMLVSVSILICHAVFAYAQFAGAKMIFGGKNASTHREYWTEDALFKASVFGGIDVNTSTPEADRTRRWAYDRLCDHSSFYPEIDCVGGASDASVCHLLKCEQFAAELQVMQMSYMYSIWDLWDVESIEPVADEPGNFTVAHHGRIASVVLFSFSFVWPHLKLMLMHIFFYIPLTSRRRRNGNYWLGVFGKWSFTDVLVMAALVGVFHLVIDTSVRDLWSRGAAEATHSCELACQSRLGVHTEGAGGAKPLSGRIPWMAKAAGDLKRSGASLHHLLGLDEADKAWDDEMDRIDASLHESLPQTFARIDAAKRWEHEAMQKVANAVSPTHAAIDMCASACSDIRDFVDESILVKGDVTGRVNLGVEMEGMLGMYAFCVAVVMSLVLSIIVERLEGLGTPLRRAEGWDAYSSGESDADDDGGGTVGEDEEDFDAAGWAEPPAKLSRAVTTPPVRRRLMTVLRGAQPFERTAEWWWHLSWVLFSAATLALGLSTPCFHRDVSGGISWLLREAGFEFNEEYTVFDLARIIADLDGLNRYLLCTTYVLFCVIGPVTRVASQILLLTARLPTSALRVIHEFSRCASIFYALEVLLLAVPVLNVTFGPMSKFLITETNAPELCGPLNKRFSVDTCLMISIELGRGYWFLVAHIVAFIYSGFDGSSTHKYCQRELHRSDCPPFW